MCSNLRQELSATYLESRSGTISVNPPAMKANRRLTLLFISGREIGYIRNRVLLAALRAHYDVTILTPQLSGTSVRIAAGLTRFLLRPPNYDVVFAGFYGQPLAIALSRLQHKPIVLDAFVSTYDTLCEDRRRFPPNSLAGRLAFWLDAESCRGARRVLTDTAADAAYLRDTFDVPEVKLTPMYVGCDETLFFPDRRRPRQAVVRSSTTVHFCRCTASM